MTHSCWVWLDACWSNRGMIHTCWVWLDACRPNRCISQFVSILLFVFCLQLWKYPGIKLMLVENFMISNVIFLCRPTFVHAVFCSTNSINIDYFVLALFPVYLLHLLNIINCSAGRMAQWWVLVGAHHHMLVYRHCKLHLRIDIVWLVT